MDPNRGRRAVLLASSIAAGGVWLGCHKEEEAEVTATEDLMREHGVIRRALIVYREAAARLRTEAGAVPADALQRTAKLLRSFAEDYHEKQL